MSPGAPRLGTSPVRMSFTMFLPSACGRGVGQEGDLARVLHGDRDVPLMLTTVAADTTGPDLAAVRDELAQQAGVLVVDVLGRVLAERADLLLDLAQDGFGHRGAPGGSGVGKVVQRLRGSPTPGSA